MNRIWLYLLICNCTLSFAQSASDEPIEQSKISQPVAFKLTPTYYSNSNQTHASDINLRANTGPHVSWLGFYQDQEHFQQLRAGYEYTMSSSVGKWVPSVQVASHGFAGGSINHQYGEEIYSILGFGRTNKKTYYNLNFDPNDAYTFGMGTQLISKTNLYFYSVHDNRFNTGQKITHWVWRYSPDKSERYTVDMASKSGSVEQGDVKVKGYSLSLGYDFSNYFIKLVRDQKVNYTQQDQTRISLGARF